MLNAAPIREVLAQGVVAEATFGISEEDEAHIMALIRDTIYSDKVLAVLREYSSNAWDEHQECGLENLPISITMPTHMKPTLTIRDFGRGLSKSDVFGVYVKFGKSTKRKTNKAVGMLGIGAKSGHAYNDSFTVTSWHAGFKSIYVAVLDKSNRGKIQLLHQEACGDETGIEIKIAVKPTDVWEFEKKAGSLFRYFVPQPDINMVLEVPVGMEGGMTHGFIQEDNRREFVAIMGCVPYRVNLDQIEVELRKHGVWQSLEHLSGGLFMPIGSVEFSGSREELKYSDTTKAVVAQKLNDLVQEYVGDAMNALTDDTASGWNRRSKACFIAHTLQFPLPMRFKDWMRRQVHLWDKDDYSASPKTFRLLNHRKEGVDRVPVNQFTRILIKDDPRELRGWRLHPYDVVVAPYSDKTLTAAQEELAKLIEDAKLDGVPIESISVRMWTAPPPPQRGRGSNQKHRVNAFRLTGMSQSPPYSSNWTIEKRVPTADDVFVVINEFKALGFSIFGYAQQDRELAKQLGIRDQCPEIYGYKTTVRKPVKAKDCMGTPYKVWRKQFFAGAMTNALRAQIRDMYWAGLFQKSYESQWDRRTDKYTVQSWVPGAYAKLVTDLGAKHPLTRFLGQHIEARKAAIRRRRQKGKVLRDDWLERLDKMTRKRKVDPATAAVTRLFNSYPLIGMDLHRDSTRDQNQHHLRALGRPDQYSAILNYVKLIDASEASK